MSKCCGGSCGSIEATTLDNELKTMRGTIQMMKISGLFSNKEVKLMEKAIESHWMYEELK